MLPAAVVMQFSASNDAIGCGYSQGLSPIRSPWITSKYLLEITAAVSDVVPNLRLVLPSVK